MKIIKILLLSIFLLSLAELKADITIRNGKLVDADIVPTATLEEHFTKGIEAYNRREWDQAIYQFRVVTHNFAHTPLGKKAFFNLGVAYYYISEFEGANIAFSEYLKHQNQAECFEEALRYKLAIANTFSMGTRRHMFGFNQMPRLFYAYDLALEIYDEILATIPSHEIACQALFSKASYHWRSREYRDAIDAYQLLIRRFPKHPLASESYVLINKVFLNQCEKEYQNPDILALAELNLVKFSRDFPGDEKLEESANDLSKIKETYAKGLYETGAFYERTRHPKASILYYQSAVIHFPDTSTAEMCKQRLLKLHAHIPYPSEVVEG
jgi:outer membrane protein assembly factor BamD (BamD/ComL family)